MGYLLFDKKPDNQGFRKGFTNRKMVSEYTGISYSTLTNHFIRDRHVWHYYEEEGIMIIHFPEMERGRQRVQMHDKKHNRNI